MELEADHRRAPLFLFLSRVLKFVVFFRCEWQHSEHELCARRYLFIIDLWSYEFTRMNLSSSPLPDVHMSTVCHQIFGVGMEGT
jgi:hypothetical protein